jgi:RNA polymerase sigma-70 factor (ECF subfamily)
MSAPSGTPPRPRSDDASSNSHRVNRALGGDRESLEWVVTRFTPLLKAQAALRLGRLQGQVSVDDVVAEAWLVALRKRADFVPNDAPSTPRLLRFLGTTILNLVNRRMEDYLRRGARQAPLPAPDDSGAGASGLADTVTGAVTHAARHETAAALDAALSELPAIDRQVIILRLVEGLSNQETALQLKESPNTASQRYGRALARLRAALPESFLSDFSPD